MKYVQFFSSFKYLLLLENPKLYSSCEIISIFTFIASQNVLLLLKYIYRVRVVIKKLNHGFTLTEIYKIVNCQ